MAKSSVVSAAVLARPAKRVHKCWFDEISPEQQAECLKARKDIQANKLAVRPIARRWKEDLKLNVSAQTIGDWISADVG